MFKCLFPFYDIDKPMQCVMYLGHSLNRNIFFLFLRVILPLNYYDGHICFLVMYTKSAFVSYNPSIDILDRSRHHNHKIHAQITLHNYNYEVLLNLYFYRSGSERTSIGYLYSDIIEYSNNMDVSCGGTMSRSHQSILLPVKKYIYYQIGTNALSSDSFLIARAYRRIGSNI